MTEYTLKVVKGVKCEKCHLERKEDMWHDLHLIGRDTRIAT